MILIDGNYFARTFFYSAKIKSKNLEDALGNFMHLFLYNIQNAKQRFSNRFGEVVIAKDSGSWRKEILESYKSNREEKNKDPEVLEFFKVYDVLISFLKDYTNTKVIKLANIEADDIIYTLSKLPGNHLVYSGDKDLVQCLKDNVKVYDFNKSRFVEKDKEMVLRFKLEHIISGDSSDNIPNIAWNSECSKLFSDWMYTKYGIEMSEAIHFKMIKENSPFFDDFKKETGKKPFKQVRMGEKTAKEIVAEGKLKTLLNTNPIIKRNFILNQMLIDLDFIPEPIINSILNEFHNYPRKLVIDFNYIYRFLDVNKLGKIRERIDLLI